MRDEVATGYRSTHTAHHHIFYRVERDTVVVVRVLHESMDVQRHLDVTKERGIEVLSSAPSDEKRNVQRR
jgi:predicted transcriptional regulator